VLLAYLIRRNWFIKILSSNTLAILLSIISILLIGFVFQQLDYAPVITPTNNIFMATYRYCFAIGAALLIALTFCDSKIGKWFKKFLSLNIWYPVAQISYPAFLIQPVIIVLVMRNFYHGQHITLSDIIFIWLISALFTMIFSAFLYACIEKPWMNARPK